MGYTPDEAALELSTFKTGYMKYVSHNKVSVLSRQARTLIYWIYAQYFIKFVDAIYQGSISYDRLTSESLCVFENEIIGKNQVMFGLFREEYGQKSRSQSWPLLS